MLNFKKQRLLVIAPHPDDEVIGVAGLIQKIKESQGKVFVLFLAVGDTKDFSEKGGSSAIARKKEVEKVAKFLKYDKYDIAFEEDTYHLQLDKLGQKKIMDVIERESSVAIEKIHPTIIAFPSSLSYNQDHRIAAFAAHAALRPAPNTAKHFVPTVITYEEPSDSWSISKQDSPNVFIALNRKQVDGKLKAMNLYSSQVRAFPNMRSLKTLETLAVLRGSMIGKGYAEAYLNYRLEIQT